MKKNLAVFLMFCSLGVFAQPTTPIGENEQGVFQVKKDSFSITKNEAKNTLWGLTVDLVAPNSKTPKAHQNFKIRHEFCDGYDTVTVLHVNDSDKVYESVDVKLDTENNIDGVVARIICDLGSQVKAKPELNKNSIQNLTSYANYAPDNLWTKDSPIATGISQATVATLTESMKFEDGNVSIIGKIRYPEKSTEYIKFFIDTDHCRNGEGVLVVNNLDGKQRITQIFNLKKSPTELAEREFFNIAKAMCSHTMSNYKFRKVIRLEDYTKPIDTGSTLLEQMYAPNPKKK